MDLVNKNKKPHWLVGFMSRLTFFMLWPAEKTSAIPSNLIKWI